MSDLSLWWWLPIWLAYFSSVSGYGTQLPYAVSDLLNIQRRQLQKYMSAC
jgi:hypothetical protein